MALSFKQREEDNRDNRRVSADLSIGVAVVPRIAIFGPMRPQFEAHVHEVSVPGMQIVSPRALTPGDNIVIWIHAKAGGDIDEPIKMKMKGSIVWSKLHENGESYIAGIHLRSYPRRSFSTWQKFALACITHRRIATTGTEIRSRP